MGYRKDLGPQNTEHYLGFNLQCGIGAILLEYRKGFRFIFAAVKHYTAAIRIMSSEFFMSRGGVM